MDAANKPEVLFFLVEDGPAKGKTVPIDEGVTVGRRNSTLVLPDKKISSLHAMVARGPDNKFKLVDLGSRNGLKCNGATLREVLLRPNVRIQIGDTHLVVRPRHVVIAEPEVRLELGEWDQAFEFLAEKLALQVPNLAKPLHIIRPPVILDFVKGLQLDTKWTVAYGPRDIGPQSLDFPIWEPEAPALCFRLAEAPEGGASFSTPHPEQVNLNQKPTASGLLNDGDVISVGGTEIEVRYKVE